MDIARLFFTRYEDLRLSMQDLDACSDAEWRARPHGLNPKTWIVWHMARAEDSGLNRLVFDRPQVLDDPGARWPERMRIPLRHHGSTMPSGEVDALNARAEVGALRAYSAAVAERTRAPSRRRTCAGRSTTRGCCGRATPGPTIRRSTAAARAANSSSCSA
jgi:hypothetical protein